MALLSNSQKNTERVLVVHDGLEPKSFADQSFI
jgi:hypothetical protein